MCSHKLKIYTTTGSLSTRVQSEFIFCGFPFAFSNLRLFWIFCFKFVLKFAWRLQVHYNFGLLFMAVFVLVFALHYLRTCSSSSNGPSFWQWQSTQVHLISCCTPLADFIVFVHYYSVAKWLSLWAHRHILEFRCIWSTTITSIITKVLPVKWVSFSLFVGMIALELGLDKLAHKREWVYWMKDKLVWLLLHYLKQLPVSGGTEEGANVSHRKNSISILKWRDGVTC